MVTFLDSLHPGAEQKTNVCCAEGNRADASVPLQRDQVRIVISERMPVSTLSAQYYGEKSCIGLSKE
jgi:hypothetical protein